MITPQVIVLDDELVMIWSMSEDELPTILVALFIHWMKPFEVMVEK